MGNVAADSMYMDSARLKGRGEGFTNARVVDVLRTSTLVVGMLCLGPIRTHAGDLPGLQARRGQSNAHGQCSLARTRDRDCSREGPLVAVPHLHSVGLLRLRGAGQGPNSVAGKRSREHAAAAYKDEDSDNEPGGIPQQWWGQAPKRARSGGLVSSALSASYSVATLPFNLAYMACAAVAAAPRAGVNWLFPPAPKQRMRTSDLLRFSGDEDKPSAIVRQISFYFSDSNLPFDTFLKGEMAKDSWGRVSLAVIASFKRMRILNATIEDIAEAAASVPFLEVMHSSCSLRMCPRVLFHQQLVLVCRCCQDDMIVGLFVLVASRRVSKWQSFQLAIHCVHSHNTRSPAPKHPD